jgi:hypothetical protein
MTPCIARDGALALAGDGVCVGCGVDPREELRDLAKRHPPAREHAETTDLRTCADALKRMVAEYIEGKQP